MSLQYCSFIVVLFILYNYSTNQILLDNYENDLHKHQEGLGSAIELSVSSHVPMEEESQEPSDSKKLLSARSCGKENDKTTMGSRELVHVEFEVHGKVQGVFFRKNTAEQAAKLKLKGWCMNTPSGTVKGAMEGEPSKIQEMKHWLSYVGSKMSRIDKAEFKNEKTIQKFSFSDFSVRR